MAENTDESAYSDLEYISDPNTFKNYFVGRFLGKGAHAKVYYVTEKTDSGREFALKIMHLETSPSSWNKSCNKKIMKAVRLNQVLKEVEIHSLMNHKNVVRLDAHFQNGSQFCMLMEYCDGLTLAQILKSSCRMDEEQCRLVLRQIIDGLEYIHGLGIIHRDLKPANIYFKNHILKIGDFGLADKVGSGRKGICGTPNYISPEVLLEHGYTTAVDVWALGCIAYHMLAGKPPFEADTQNATYEFIRAHHYEPLTRSQAGAAVRHLINWMLAYLPEERPTASNIRNHAWMGYSNRISNSNYRNLQREDDSDNDSFEEIHYQLLQNQECEKSLNKDSSFWSSLLKKVPVKKVPSFHLTVPSTLLNIRNKVSYLFRFSTKEEECLKAILADILKISGNGSLGEEIPPRQIPIFVTKWVDYGNKFGFGYQLSNETTGIIFNDDTQIILDGTKTAVTFCSNEDRLVYPISSIPKTLKPKLKLLKYIQNYMDVNLSSGLEGYAVNNAIPNFISSWKRNEKAIIFQGPDILQINFIQDHWKFIFYSITKDSGKIYHLVTIDDAKRARRYNLMRLREIGCPDEILNYLIDIYSLL